jgi:hypothetical protein
MTEMNGQASPPEGYQMWIKVYVRMRDSSRARRHIGRFLGRLGRTKQDMPFKMWLIWASASTLNFGEHSGTKFLVRWASLATVAQMVCPYFLSSHSGSDLPLVPPSP